MYIWLISITVLAQNQIIYMTCTVTPPFLDRIPRSERKLLTNDLLRQHPQARRILLSACEKNGIINKVNTEQNADTHSVVAFRTNCIVRNGRVVQKGTTVVCMSPVGNEYLHPYEILG